MARKTHFGRLLRRWRLHKVLTPSDFARRVGVSRVAVFQWESGETSPRQSRMARVVAALGCTMSEFYAGPPPATTKPDAAAA